MKKLLFLVICSLIQLGCIDSRRISTYETLKTKYGFDEILQSNWEVWNSGDIYNILNKEIDLRIKYMQDTYIWSLKITNNGTCWPDKTSVNVNEVMKRQNRVSQYTQDIKNVIWADGLENVLVYQPILTKLKKINDDIKALDEKVKNATYDFSILYKDGDAKNEIAIDLNNYLKSSGWYGDLDEKDWNTAKLTYHEADILKAKGIYYSKAKKCWVVRKKAN